MASSVNWRQVGHFVAGVPTSGAPQRWQVVGVIPKNVAPTRHQFVIRARAKASLAGRIERLAGATDASGRIRSSGACDADAT